MGWSVFLKHERSFPHIQEGEPAFFCHGLYRAVSHGRIERGVQLRVDSFIMSGNAASAAERRALAAPSGGTGDRPGAACLDEMAVFPEAAAAICCPFPKLQGPLTGAAVPCILGCGDLPGHGRCHHRYPLSPARPGDDRAALTQRGPAGRGVPNSIKTDFPMFFQKYFSDPLAFLDGFGYYMNVS